MFSSISERDLKNQTASEQAIRNQAAQRDDPPRCGNCDQMERRIKEREEQLEVESRALAWWRAGSYRRMNNGGW